MDLEEGSRRSPEGGGDDGGGAGSAAATGQHQHESSPLLPLHQLTVGTRLEVYWPDDDAFYPGTIGAHLPNEWQPHIYTINYDDGEVETVDMSIERFRILGGKRRVTADAAVGDGDAGGDYAACAVEGGTEIRSLTVRFDCGNEMWRSPPTYGVGEDFLWPEGWVEVRRLATTSGDDDYGSDDGDDDYDDDDKEGGRYVREFHPPYPPGHRGRTKVCRSMEEVENYIVKQKEKQLKQEQLEARRKKNDESSRRSGRQRRSIQQPCADPRNSVIPEGPQGELNKIMKQKGRLAHKMTESILLGAVLAKKKDLLETGAGFLGANGRMYPDLRKAFGKHTDIKQCSLCKSRVQGHWFCRITHGHLDRPDYDGGDSAEQLRDLFRFTVEELEDRLENLQYGDKKRAAERNDSANEGFGDDGEWSMNVLSEDLLYQIAAYLPSLSQLSSFCKTSKRGQQLLYNSVHSEKLFRGTFLRTFGERATRGNFERDLTWRERWAMIRDLRRGFLEKSIRPPTAVARQLKDTIGVLLPQDEREAIYYDNQEYGDPDRATCNGYFGLEILHLPRPPNAGTGWQPPIVVRGDFNGVRIFSSASESLFQTNSVDGGGGQRSNGNNSSVTVGGDEGGGQVLSLIHCDVHNASHEGPCCFIGYASGRVAAVSATLNADGDGYAFAISGTHHAHESEVTDLAFVDCSPSSPGDNNDNAPVLFSACCAGKVYFYPKATDPKQNYSLEKSVLAFTNFYDCPIFSLASTVLRSRDGTRHSVLCTGDRDGNIRVWLKPDDDLLGLCTSTDRQKFRHLQLYKSSAHRGTGYHLVTRAMFIKDGLLLTGTNNGDVRFWQMKLSEDSIPALTLRYDLMGIHNGAVEYLTNVGDILLSSGGNDGEVVGWDINTGLRLGSVRCHPGRRMEEGGGRVVCSCVVDLLISGKDSSLISLCRDGSLKQLKIML